MAKEQLYRTGKNSSPHPPPPKKIVVPSKKEDLEEEAKMNLSAELGLRGVLKQSLNTVFDEGVGEGEKPLRDPSGPVGIHSTLWVNFSLYILVSFCLPFKVFIPSQDSRYVAHSDAIAES